MTRAVNLLHPFFAPECVVSFYGGEPLLAFDFLERAVAHLDTLSTGRKVKIRYSLTTNGSLLNDDILGFLDERGFSLTLSFDGLAQDLGRKKGTFDLLTSVIPRILARPGISLETNSVFSSETIGYLSGSVQSIIGLGVRKLDVNFADKPVWTTASLLCLQEEIARIGEYFVSNYANLTDIPWSSFSEERAKSVYHCPAGRDQMALTAQGTLWGCAAFPYYFVGKNGTTDYQKYCFGDVDSFIKNPQRIYNQRIAYYSELSMDRFSTPDRSCLICEEIEKCWVCPLAAATTTGEIGRIPSWSCKGAKILRKEKRRFLNRFNKRFQRSEARAPI